MQHSAFEACVDVFLVVGNERVGRSRMDDLSLAMSVRDVDSLRSVVTQCARELAQQSKLDADRVFDELAIAVSKHFATFVVPGENIRARFEPKVVDRDGEGSGFWQQIAKAFESMLGEQIPKARARYKK